MMWLIVALLVWSWLFLAVYLYLEIYSVYLRWKRGKE